MRISASGIYSLAQSGGESRWLFDNLPDHNRSRAEQKDSFLSRNP